MKRCLHITVHESSNGAQRRGPAYPRRSGTDPESGYEAPDPDDPESGYVAPDPDDPEALYAGSGPDDPESGYVAPDPDDPGSGSYPPGGYHGHPGVTVHECGCAAPAGPKACAGSGKTAHPFIAPRHYSGFVIVRMAEGMSHDPARTLLELAGELKLAGLQAVLERMIDSSGPASGVLDSWPLVELQEMDRGWLECSPPRPAPLPPARSREIIRELEKKAAKTAFAPLHSLTSYWRLDLRKHPALVEEVVADLNRLAEVDLAYRELAAFDPQHTAEAGKQFADDQGYLEAAPAGIGASWVWETLNGTASSTSKVTLCDLEQGWTTAHLDLAPHVPSTPFFGWNRALDEEGSGHHGTAVLGQLAANGKSPLGIKGAASGLGQFVLASHYRARTADELPGTNGHVAAAIVQALMPGSGIPGLPLEAGSILLLEVQRGLLPTEINEFDFDAIRLASAHGIIVVEAAGNGGFDLDAYTDPATGRSLRRGAPNFRDSGAILVGAARPALHHDRAPFSNYGSRVDCFGWGETVTTCGYGDLAGTGDTDFYTNAFSGTSSASPIIAGAAALVQALHKDRAGFPLEPRALRALLSDPETGTRQGSNVHGHIGVMPDLEAIVRGRLQLVPDVYMRRCVGDHGSKRGKDEEISSSPDILLWRGSPQEVEAFFGEGSKESHPAPGSTLDPEAPNKVYGSGSPNLYVRLRNRGLGNGRARVQLFASPAATLITPERWMSVGDAVEIDEIPQGDSFKVSGPVPANLPQQWSLGKSSSWPKGIVPPYSFLAVQLPSGGAHNAPGYERTVMLPPGPPYFDWDEYRSFLRGPGVAWRNVYPVRAGSGMTLAFLLAGTPDRTRRFDFEVIQRLPAGVEVTLKVPPALAAKLRQNRPWLANGSGDLELPHRPRTPLGRVAIAPGPCAHSSFQVKVVSPGVSLEGRSLAIRQLWRGEEVGRITWWFVA